MAAPMPTASTMAGVPASKRCGAGLKVDFSKVTEEIISPPPW